MIVLAGKTCSGKDTIVNQLVKMGYQKVTTYTTRPMRENEIDGVTYHYITDKEFKEKVNNGFFAEHNVFHTEFGDWYYGSAREDYVDGKSVIILTPSGLKDIKQDKELSKLNITSFYIIADNETLQNRLIKRGDNPNEAMRRLESDSIDFANIDDLINHKVLNNGKGSPETVAMIIDSLYE